VHVLADTYPSALNEPTEDGMLPLHVADRYATSVGGVQRLATASPGALTKRTSSRWLPIHFAANRNMSEVVQVLASACRESLAGGTKRGCLALHYATLDVVRFLAARTNHGWLPIRYAARYSTLEAVQFLARKVPKRSRRGPTRTCCTPGALFAFVLSPTSVQGRAQGGGCCPCTPSWMPSRCSTETVGEAPSRFNFKGRCIG
jgi:Ankyrin repeats (3 copies)